MSEILMPYYRIYICGKELDDFRYSMIQSITFEDYATGSDLLTIEILDPEFIFLDDKIFVEDVKIKFVGGFDNNYRTMFEGYISVIDADFPETGSPSLTIHCMDNTHLMNRVKKKRTWNNKTRAQVVPEVFKEYGFKVVIEDTGIKQESISQSNETDIAFITKLAGEEIDPYLVYVEGNTGYYVRKKVLEKQQATLDYRDGLMNVISFQPRINKETKQVEVRASDVNLLDNKVDKAQANDNTSREASGTSPQSDDRSNSKNSWVYQGNSSWRQTY